MSDESTELRQDTYFAIIPEWVLFSTLSDRAIRLYAVLMRRAGETGQAYPGRSWLADQLDCSKATLDRAVRELDDAGAVCKVRRRHDDGDFDFTLYTVHTTRCSGCSDDQGEPLPLPPGDDDPSSPVSRGRRTGEATGSRVGDEGVAAWVSANTESIHTKSLMTASGEPTLTSDDDDDPRSSRNEVWDTLAEIFFPAGVTTRATEKRLGRVVATLTRAGATRGDILARRDRWPDLWPGKQTPTLTLEALEKWWDTLAVVDPPGGDDCDRCSNRRQLARLFDGTVAPFGSDQAEAVGVDYPIRCPDCLPAQAAEQLRAMP